MNKKKVIAKIAEIFFASGTPILAFAKFAKNADEFFNGLALFIAIIIAAGWHIKTVNDETEDRNKNFRLNTEIIVSLVALVILLCLKTGVIIPILLICLNWYIYSFLGKNFYPLSMLNNFSGGFLHFCLGASAANMPFFESISSPEGIFFAFAMLCGSMHHDSYHEEEDKERGFHTGANIFGAKFWWQLAVFPMIAAIPFLLNSEKLFAKIFCSTAVFPYFFAYFVVLIFIEKPQNLIIFRSLCRLFFGLAAAIYIICKIFVFKI